MNIYMRWLYVMLIILGLLNEGVSQVSFVDFSTQQPISGANLYLQDGRLIGFTNKEGAMELLNNLSFSVDSMLKLTVQHISYQEKRISVYLNSSEVVFMNPRAILLDSIEIKLKKEADVVVLKGYYRSLETFNSQRKYFSDGLIEVFIPRVKGQVKYRYLQRRVFRDSVVSADYNSRMGAFFQIPRLPKFSTKMLSDILKDYTLMTTDQHNFRLLKKGEEVGLLSTTVGSDFNGETRVYRDLVLPKSVKKEKIFRIEAHTYKELDLVTYSSTDIVNISPSNITSVYQNIVASIKRKKEYGHIPFEGLNEFYVMERSGISFKEYKNIEHQLIRNIYKTPEKSDFTQEYWKELNIFEIPSTAFDLNDKLYSDLRLVK